MQQQHENELVLQVQPLSSQLKLHSLFAYHTSPWLHQCIVSLMQVQTSGSKCPAALRRAYQTSKHDLL